MGVCFGSQIAYNGFVGGGWGSYSHRRYNRHTGATVRSKCPMRGGREMDNHFECMWDLFRSIPSIETDGISVLDEYYWLNKKDPNYSLCRATQKRGEDAHMS